MLILLPIEYKIDVKSFKQNHRWFLELELFKGFEMERASHRQIAWLDAHIV
jgi:hypothetical protein